MNSPEGPLAALPLRLRALRLAGLAGKRITQKDLAEALEASVPLISSWESTTNPTVPPEIRLHAYATFFATERSVTGRKYRVLDLSELTDNERARQAELLEELTDLRSAALGSEVVRVTPELGGLWRFPAGQDVTIICAELPLELRQPYADPASPDYVRSYGLADLASLIELYGHIRAANPLNAVGIRKPSELRQDDLTAHLAILGGVDWNPVTRTLGRLIELPIHQLERESGADPGGFELESNRFTPSIRKKGGSEELIEDVAQFYRGPNPFNRKRTATICNGTYGRGTFGAVRASTDPRFRDRNEAYVRNRTPKTGSFNILTRVLIVNGEVVTPDWTLPEVRLHEWFEEA